MSLRMPFARITTSCLLFTVSAVAQAPGERVTNGDFDQGFASWTQSGLGGSPSIDLVDVDGFGSVDPAFGANPLVSFFGFGAFTIAQDVDLNLGAEYEFHAELSCTAPPGGDARTETLLFRLPNQELARVEFGTLPGGTVRRETFTVRFTATLDGPQELQCSVFKVITVAARTARFHVDEVSIRPIVGPTFRIDDERDPGATVATEVVGANPGESVAVFFALQRSAPLAIPGMGGSLELGGFPLLVENGPTDAVGRRVGSLALPAGPAFEGLPLFFQALAHGAGEPRFGIARNFGIGA